MLAYMRINPQYKSIPSVAVTNVISPAFRHQVSTEGSGWAALPLQTASPGRRGERSRQHGSNANRCHLHRFRPKEMFY